MKYYIRGGIGDFLQVFWFVKHNKNEEFIIHTHYKQAESFFESFGLTNSNFYYFSNIEEHDSQVDEIIKNHGENSTSNIKECPRAFYSDINFLESNKTQAESFITQFKKELPIIGIHPFGSNFAFDVYSKFNLPIKFLPLDLIEKIITPNFNYIIFGSKSELSSYGIKELDNLLLTNLDINSCLELVKKCSGFVGTDSCFKTMSSMNRIPTFCILGDFQDELRDSFFINQYEKDGIMSVFKTKNIETDKQKIENSIINDFYKNYKK